jgi:hypothetical protein
MSETLDSIKQFVAYARLLRGDEKGEAQVFCDRLFQAFGHKGYKEAGATLEHRIKRKGDPTKFVDLLWADHVLIEMKKRGAKLALHYKQALDYWVHAVPNRPRYVVLCNFDSFWIYDFENQVDQPVDVVRLEDLPKRFTALNFLFPDGPKPVFGNDLVAVTRNTANKIGDVFRSLVKRKEDKEKAQRFVLQCVVALFAEDIDLLPSGIMTRLISDCAEGKQSSYDLLGGLFRQMNSLNPATGGLYRGVRYFNGGLYGTVDPCELSEYELYLLSVAAKEDWSKVNPAIFGSLFQASMDDEERHLKGAHFTSEADIMRVVDPTIVRPFMNEIENANALKDLVQIRNNLTKFHVLDPACGSGNFLYVSFRELVRVEMFLLAKARAKFSRREVEREFKSTTLISPKQFLGIDRDPFGVELAKVTLMLAKKLAIDEAIQVRDEEQLEMLPLTGNEALPLDNLDSNFMCDDALFVKWPKADVIVGNPPFQSKNKMQEEFGRGYLAKLHEAYPEVPGLADYCVYWFRKAHDHLCEGQRAGLVGTNTIRQNYSREGSLDYIVSNGGTITEAVSSQVWSGDAVVHVSIVNWIKGEQKGKKRLSIQEGDQKTSTWRTAELDQINTALSFDVDITKAKRLFANASSGGCYQGQTHGHEAFILSPAEAKELIKKDPKCREVIFPYLIADDLIGTPTSLPTRFAIDFSSHDLVSASSYGPAFERIKNRVLPDRQAACKEERSENEALRSENPDAKLNKHKEQFLKRWWQFSWPRAEMIAAINKLPRYVVCGSITKRPIFEFVSPEIHPNAALTVFPFADDYSFGILQSDVHWLWFINRCSTMKADPRYTSNTVFDTFPWPQAPRKSDIVGVAQAAVKLRTGRRALMKKHRYSLRELYRTLELPGTHPLKELHLELDEAVRKTYGMAMRSNPLILLRNLNADLAAKEAAKKQVVGPGLPIVAGAESDLVSSDGLRMQLA